MANAAWLDPSRLTTGRRILGRTLHRMITREELWNGNREQPRNLFSPHPAENIVLWSFTHHTTYRERYARLSRDPAWARLEFIRIGSSADARRLLERAERLRGD